MAQHPTTQTLDRKSAFLGLPPEEQLKVLLKTNPAFSGLPPQEQQKVISSINEGKKVVAQEFSQGKITEEDPDFFTARNIFDLTRQTVEPLSVAVGGLVGFGVGGVPGALGGAGLLGGGTKQLFRFIENVLGARGVEDFEDVGLTKDITTPVTLKQLSEKSLEVTEDLATSILEEGAGRALTRIPGEITAGLVGGVAGFFSGEENKILRTVAGATAGALGTATFKRAGLTDFRAKKIALKKFKDAAAGTPDTQAQIDKNVFEARSLEDKIPGLKFSIGELTDDASVKRLQASLSKAGVGADLSQSERAMANRAIDRYFLRNVTGPGTPGAFIKEVADTAAEFQSATKNASDTVSLEVTRLSRSIDPEFISQNIKDKLRIPLDELKAVQKKLFSSVPKLQVKTQPMADAVDSVKKQFVQDEPRNFRPTGVIRQIENAIFETIEKKVVSGGGLTTKIVKEQVLRDVPLQRIRGISQTIDALIKKARGGTNPNNVLARRLQILKSSITGGFDEGKLTSEGAFQLTARSGDQTSKGIRILQEANAARVDQAIRFERGTVGKVLQRGQRGEETRVALANIASEFNTLGGIDDLSRALGSKELATDAMSDFFRMDLLNAPGVRDATTGNLSLKAINKWIAKNALKLKKLGLSDEFKNTAKLQESLEVAADRLDIFNKSVAGRVLGAEPGEFVEAAFTSTKNLERTANELMALTRGNKAAQRGLKRAVSLRFLEMSESATRSFFQGASPTQTRFVTSSAKFTENAKKFKNALAVIYRDEPEKLKALNRARKAFEILSRTARQSGGTEQVGLADVEVAVKTGIAGAGAAAPRIAFAIKVINNVVESLGKGNIDKYLRRMVFDPDYALALMKETASDFSPKAFDRLMVALISESNLIDKAAGQVKESVLGFLPPELAKPIQ